MKLLLSLRSLCAFSFCLIIAAFIPGGEPSLTERIVGKLKEYNTILPQEKVFLHLDKPYYSPGDTLWFKGYLVDAMNHLPDSASKVLYVDLTDEAKGQLLFSRILRVNEGFTHGQIELPDTLKEGIYTVRSYTNWMRNFPEALYFKKDFRIIRDVNKSYDDGRLSKLARVAELQFFPEGGNLIAGINGRVAFKAANVAGNGIETQGYLLNSKKDTIIIFSTRHLGMGYFGFTPVAGETYSALIKNKDKSITSFSFPEVKPQGYAMGVDNLTKKDEIRIFVSNNIIDKNDAVLVAHQHGVIHYAAGIPGGKGLVRVPRKNFIRDGIVHFTLFHADGTPVCERLIFIDNQEDVQLDITTQKGEYKPHEQVDVGFTLTDASGDPIAGNFSVSVTDENQVNHDAYEENIKTHILLSSETTTRGQVRSLQGLIEQPAYYFDHKNTNATTDLDVLLMTQGWRRFAWDDVLNKKTYDTTFAVEQGLTFTGKATQRNNQPPAKQLPLIFMLTNEQGLSEFVQGLSLPDGKFIVTNASFTGPTTISASTQDKEKKIRITFDSAATAPKISLRDVPEESMWAENSVLTNYLLRMKEYKEIQFTKSKMLKELVVKAERIVKDDPRRGLLPKGGISNTLAVDERICGGANHVLQMLLGKVSGIKISFDGSAYHAILRAPNSFNLSVEPLYIVDGVPVDVSYVGMITPCDIEKIEVFKGPIAQYGSRGSTGVIAFYTRSPNDPLYRAQASSGGLSKMIRNGYAASRQFYTPQYSSQKPSIGPDHRSTLHWQPYVVTDASGKAQVSFWTSDDGQTDFRIRVEGITYDGRQVSATTTRPVR